jgi:ribonuclease E
MMTDQPDEPRPNDDHWGELISDLGVTPTEPEPASEEQPGSPAVDEQSASKSRGEAAESPPAEKTTRKHPRRPAPKGDWDSLAGELGIALPEPPSPEESAAPSIEAPTDTDLSTEERVVDSAAETREWLDETSEAALADAVDEDLPDAEPTSTQSPPVAEQSPPPSTSAMVPFDSSDKPLQTLPEDTPQPWGLPKEAEPPPAQPESPAQTTAEPEEGPPREAAGKETEDRPSDRKRRRRRRKPKRESADDSPEQAAGAEPAEMAADESAASEAEDAETREEPKTKRRRRRRSGKKKDAMAEASQDAKADDRLADVEFDDRPEELSEEEGDRKGSKGRAPKAQRNIPSWEDAVQLIVKSNLDKRSKSSKGSSNSGSRGRGGRGRGRGGRGRSGSKKGS